MKLNRIPTTEEIQKANIELVLATPEEQMNQANLIQEILLKDPGFAKLPMSVQLGVGMGLETGLMIAQIYGEVDILNKMFQKEPV